MGVMNRDTRSLDYSSFDPKLGIQSPGCWVGA